ncbi:MAG: DUF4102 domain-containing protein [Acetobacteraceae bacterium]|nr:DUF4102 domain-containing protein [Acetobacteraceae bacterium]
MASRRITAPALERLNPRENLWDTEVRGLGARRQVAGGSVTFVFKYVAPNPRRQRYITIGKWGRGNWGIDEARKRATELRNAVRLGRDPAADREAKKTMLTVSELCDAYLAAAQNGDPRLLKRNGSPKKLTTLANDRGRVEGHIKPLLGAMPVDGVARRDMEAFTLRVAKGATAQRRKVGMRAVSIIQGGRGAASRTVGLLGAIFAYAQKLELRTDNPCRGVTRFADQKRERRLSDEEYRALPPA